MIEKIDAWDKYIVQTLNNYISYHSSNFSNKFFSEYLIYSLPILFIGLWFWGKDSKKVALRAFFSAFLAWPVLANIIGRIVNRPRPIATINIQELLFHRPDYSFPSDHASALFAVSFSLWISGYKKLAIFLLLISIIVSFFRISLGLHFPSDILGGIILGLLSAYLINLFDKPLDIIYNFILRFAKIVRLA